MSLENTPEQLQSSDKKSKSPRKSVQNYLMVLFAAAFFLLVLTLLMEQRTNNEIVDTLSDQIVYAQSSHSDVTTQRDQLETALTDAEAEIAQLKEDNEALQRTLEAADEGITRADQLRVALEQLENIETLCQLGLYEDALANIENFEQTSAFALLQTQTQPIQPVWGDPIPSPWEQYQALRETIMENTAD